MSSERFMSPPSPVESADSFDSGPAAAPTATTESTTESTGKIQRSDDVMITLSLPPQPVMTPRSRSPLARSHFRSRSLAEVPNVPPMTRAYSSPGLDSRGRYIFVNGRGAPTSNPLENGKRHPFLQVATGDALESRMAPLRISEPIAEHSELDTAMNPSSHTDAESAHAVSPAIPTHHTFPRMGRRRPSSPLHFHSGNASSPGPFPTYSSSPVMLGSKYNEAFPSYSSSSASSMPSTPTSLRSRSPSISSLETIPDIPDAEAAASEADQVAALKAAADRIDEAEASGAGNRRRGTSDAMGPAGSLVRGGYGVRADKRKRWSVCGAERRQDLDLETIWED